MLLPLPPPPPPPALHHGRGKAPAAATATAAAATVVVVVVIVVNAASVERPHRYSRSDNVSQQPAVGTKSANISREKMKRTYHSLQEVDSNIKEDDLPGDRHDMYKRVLHTGHVPDAEVDDDILHMT